MKHFFLLILATMTLIAADATGTWTGSLMVPGDGGENHPARLVLKQDGSKLTGTAGPSAGEQHEIQNGKVEDGVLTFDVPTGETTMKFTLKQDGDEIKGDISREHEGETQHAKLAVKREPAK